MCLPPWDQRKSSHSLRHKHIRFPPPNSPFPPSQGKLVPVRVPERSLRYLWVPIIYSDILHPVPLRQLSAFCRNFSCFEHLLSMSASADPFPCPSSLVTHLPNHSSSTVRPVIAISHVLLYLAVPACAAWKGAPIFNALEILFILRSTPKA